MSRRRRPAWPALVLAAAGVVVASGALATTAPAVTREGVTVPSAWDWPSYGQNAQHTFSARTTLTPASVKTLSERWFFPTGTSTTITPTVVDGTVYAGSWDQWFYAIDLSTGKLEWKFHTFPQPAITPYPGQNPRDISSDGGMITSSAWFQPGNETRPDLVIFGGGYTLYALDAHTGRLYWSHRYTGRPTRPPDPGHDGARIFSSPVVFDHKVFFGTSVDGQSGERGYVVAATLTTGKPVWIYESDRNTEGKIPNDGCGNVWSSGSILPRQGLVVFGMADCNFADPPPYAESIFALRVANGTVAWRYRPSHPASLTCDWDFGASVNIGLGARTEALFVGDGSKDGTYYSVNPTTGKLIWSRNMVFGGFSGGFIGTSAYADGTVYGATALGTFGRTTTGVKYCDPSTPRDVNNQQPSLDAIGPGGTVRWADSTANSFGPTTVAGGMVFTNRALAPTVTVRSAADGSMLDTITPRNISWSGIAVVGNAVVFGVGSGPDVSPAGIEVYTPGGEPPAVPGEHLG